MNKLNIFFTVHLLFIMGCVFTETNSKEHLFYVKSREERPNLKFDIIRGSSILNKERGVYQLDIQSVRGGSKYFLGKKVNEISGDKTKRIFLVENRDTIESYAVEDLLALDYEILEDSIKVYLLPL